MKTKLLAPAIAVVAIASATAVSAQRLSPAVIAVVDTDRVSRECTACRTAQTQLEAQVASVRALANQLRGPLQTEANAIEVAARALAGKQPDAALNARVQALRTRENSANQQLTGREQSLRSTQAHVNQQISQRLLPIINSVMTARGAALVVDKAATLASSASLDVTNDVLAQLNQQLPSVSVTPLPTAPKPARPQGR